MRFFTFFFSYQVFKIPYVLHLMAHLNSDSKFPLEIVNLYLDFISFALGKGDSHT